MIVSSGQWEIAQDVQEVHNLLCICDAYHTTSSTCAPHRNITTTMNRVIRGTVHLLRQDEIAVAMFTLTWFAPFDQNHVNWLEVNRPIYMSRLAVHPTLLREGTILGLRCYRRAIELATLSGADAIRLEANPDLERVKLILQMLRFVCQGQQTGSDGLKRIYLQKTLDEPRRNFLN